MRGQKLIKTTNAKLSKEIEDDYKQLIFKEKIKKGLFTVGQISAKLLLVAGAFAGGMALAVAAPNVIGAVGKLAGNKKEKTCYFNCDRKKFNRAMTYLKNRHLIEVIYEKDKTSLKLTPKGERRYCIQFLDNMFIEKLKRWDSRWRVVIFDIPEKFKIAREAIRQKLNDLGFYQIQKSVFIFPYPCEKEINFIRHLFGLENQIRIIDADYFQEEEGVKKYFRMK